MKDSEYVFKQEIRDKKRTARGAKYMNRTGKGSVRMPSDYLTRKERNRMNGPVVTYDMGGPMAYDVFKKMPLDLQRAYLLGLREKFHPTNLKIAELWGITSEAVRQCFKRLGLDTKGGYGDGFDEGAWDAWIGGDVVIEKVADAGVVVEAEKQAEVPVVDKGGRDSKEDEKNFKMAAGLWNVYLGVNKIQAKDVAAMLALLKIARVASGTGGGMSDLVGYVSRGEDVADG